MKCPWCPHEISDHRVDVSCASEPVDCTKCKCSANVEAYYRAQIDPCEHGIQ